MADQLERLFQALVRRVRDMRPEHLSRPFEVAEILRTFVPYRTTRVEVGVEAAEDYEVLILRLLSGERGFVFTDDAMQDDLRRELDSGNPDLRALHAYGTAKLTLAQHAMRQVLEASPAPAPSGAAPSSGEPAVPGAPRPGVADPAPAQVVLRDGEGRVVAALAREAPLREAPPREAPPRAPQSADVSAALDALQRELPNASAPLGEVIGATIEPKARASFQARGSRIPDPTAEMAMRTPRPGCRFCGQLLPDGRTVTFCPHCGQNLKVLRCPGCSAEMDPAWKFCVTCGRAAASS